MASSRARRWVQFGVSAALLVALLWVIPIRQLTSALRLVSPGVLLSTLVVLLAGHVAAAIKWRLLQGGTTGISLIGALRAHFYGVLASLWLPGVIGGDVVRAGVVYRETTRRTLVVVASLVDRIVDSISLVGLAAAGALWFGSPSRGMWRVMIVVSGVAVVSGLTALVLHRIASSRYTANPRVGALVEAVDLMLSRPARVAAACAISVSVQTAFILVNVQLGHAVGMTAPTAAWFMAWPLAKFAALIPISAAGLGVREAALIALMRPFGDPVEVILAAGLLWQAVFVAGGVLGVTFSSLLHERDRFGGERVGSATVSQW